MIKLKKIEKDLGIKLKRNTISIGFDVSVHSTGIAIIRTTDNTLIIDRTHKITVPHKVELFDAVDLFLEQLGEFKKEVSKKYKLDINIIEDCFFGSNVKTLKSLARFSILVYVKMKNISKVTKMMLPNSARSIIGFKKSSKKIKGHALKKEIISYINIILHTKYRPKDSDMADACVLALSGLKA